MKLQPVSSSNIEAVGYDKDKRDLCVQFKSGGTYTYHGVPEHVHSALVNATSVGGHFAKHVNGKFRHTKH